MLLPVVAFLFVVLILSVRVKGPFWAAAIAWLVSIVPIATGILTFSYLRDPQFGYSLILIGYLSSFFAGLCIFYTLPRRLRSRPAPNTGYQAAAPLPFTVKLCWWVGMVGTAFVVIDFYLLGGAGLSDLAALRDTYVEKTSASLYAQLGSVMTWACLYCFIYVLVNRGRLRWVQNAVLLLPIGGYFLISLLSAGRQAAFQVMLVTILTFSTIAARRRFFTGATHHSREKGSKLLIAGISAAMIFYMGYIAVARNDNVISDDKTEVLIALFDFNLSPTVEAVGTVLGQSTRAVMVEAMVYFSASVPVFQKFLTLDHTEYSFGAMSYPFFMRQIQPYTGISPSDVMAHRVDSLNSIGVIGAGWTTAISNYLMDFGVGGTVLMLLLSGYYSAFAWERAIRSDHFEDIVIGILVLLSAIYMPLFPAISDTNLLLLWLFCIVVSVAKPLAPTAGPRTGLNV